MLDQAFSARNLRRLLRKEDVAKFRMWRPGDDRDAVMNTIADEVNDSLFTFGPFREKRTGGKILYSAPDAPTMLILRKLDRNIRAIYGVKQANRDDMVHQVKSLMREGCAFTVLRLDIRSFYESIDRERVLSQIVRDSILSYTSRTLLRKLFEAPQLAGRRGVPRGLGVSATLAELYVRGLDRHICSLRHVYFYGRYVDDMVVFTHADPVVAEDDIQAALKPLSLKLHPDKRTILTCCATKNRGDRSFHGFDFLGYHTRCRRYLDDKRGWRDVEVRIAQKKVKKIKSRIAHALVDYVSTPDFPLLLRRMRFLAGNYTLRGTDGSGLCGGIYYNYHHITDHCDLDDLDGFFRRLVFARTGSIGRRLYPRLTDAQRRDLVRIGFKAAFAQRFTRRLPWGEMKELRRCWEYEKN